MHSSKPFLREAVTECRIMGGFELTQGARMETMIAITPGPTGVSMKEENRQVSASERHV